MNTSEAIYLCIWKHLKKPAIDDLGWTRNELTELREQEPTVITKTTPPTLTSIFSEIANTINSSANEIGLEIRGAIDMITLSMTELALLPIARRIPEAKRKKIVIEVFPELATRI